MHRLLNQMLLASLLSSPLAGQTLVADHVRNFTLKGGVPVMVLPARACANCYYYLPTDFRVSVNEAGQPELSLLKIRETDNDPISAGILHVLLVWGLDSAKEQELESLLRAKQDSAAVLLGVAAVEERYNADGAAISGDDELARTLRASLTNHPGTPTTPGAKIAFSFRLNQEQIRTLLDLLDKSKFKSDTAFEIGLTCWVELPEDLGRRPVNVTLAVKATDLFPLLR